MKLQCYMVVMGDPIYYECAHFAVSSFCSNNPNSELIVFTDEQFKPMNYDNLTILKYNECAIKNNFKVNEVYARPFQNFDKVHNHTYIQNIFAMMADNGYADFLCKLDADMYFVGPVIKDLEAELTYHDLYLIKRQHSMMKLYRGDPGVGVTVFRREGEFLEKYIELAEKTSSYEQDLVLDLRQHLMYKEIPNQNLHIVYLHVKNPFITKDQIDLHFPGNKIIHCNTLEQLKQMEHFYGTH